MEITTNTFGSGITMINLKGEMDMYNSHKLKDLALTLLHEGTEGLVINLQELEYIDSSGISVLIFVYTTMQKNKRSLWFINVKGSVEKVIELTKLKEFFPIVKSIEEIHAQIKKKIIPAARG